MKCDRICHEIGMRKYSKNVFSCVVFLKDKLTETKCKFAQFWFAIQLFHRNLTVPDRNLRKKYWLMSFPYLFEVSDDAIPSHGRICACDMSSVFLCITFILNGRLGSKPKNDRSNAYGWVNRAVGAMQRPSTMHAQKDNSVTCVLSLMMSTATRNSQQFLILQMLYMCGVTL